MCWLASPTNTSLATTMQTASICCSGCVRTCRKKLVICKICWSAGGGNASGVNIGNIDNTGKVHPDSFWWHYTIGNVKERKFSEIWQDVSDPVMAGLNQSPRQIKGRCGSCKYFNICNGNTRSVRCS